MQRFTVSLDDDLADLFDVFLHRYGYGNRSEAIRDLIRNRLEASELEQSAGGHSVGAVTYVYSHKERELANRLARAQHLHHEITVSTLRVQLDHEHCLETMLLNGATDHIRTFAESVIARPGVRHGQLYLLPVTLEQFGHGNGIGDSASSTHPHIHVHPTV